MNITLQDWIIYLFSPLYDIIKSLIAKCNRMVNLGTLRNRNLKFLYFYKTSPLFFRDGSTSRQCRTGTVSRKLVFEKISTVAYGKQQTEFNVASAHTFYF